MQPIDWFLFSIPIAVIAVFCFHSQKYIRSVADFLAAGRTGGRYLLSSANGMAGMGLITLAVAMQNFRLYAFLTQVGQNFHRCGQRVVFARGQKENWLF